MIFSHIFRNYNSMGNNMKKNLILFITILVLSGSASTSLAGESFLSWLFSLDRQNEVVPVTDEIYIEECGACHFPYQPGLLPERSWRKLSNADALENHFGENAELDEETRLYIFNVLSTNSADKSLHKRSKKIMVSLADNEAPLRITNVPYIRRKHHEVYEKVVKKSNEVKSLSFCDKCHRKAAEGIYDDDTVIIPGYGKWTR